MKIERLLGMSVMIAAVSLLGCGANYEAGPPQPSADAEPTVEVNTSADNSPSGETEPAKDIVDTAVSANRCSESFSAPRPWACAFATAYCRQPAILSIRS